MTEGRPAHRYVLSNARVPAALLDGDTVRTLTSVAPGLLKADVVLEGDTVAAVLAQAPQGLPVVDARNGVLLTPWVDAHTHLDKCYTAARLMGSFHRLSDAVGATAPLRAHWSPDDLQRRMLFALQTARSHGTRAVRTHLDWVQASPPLAWSVACAVREAVRHEMVLQLVSISPLALFRDPAAARAVARTLAEGGGVLGASVHPMADQAELLQRVFALAREFNLNLDFHVDEHLLPDVNGIRTVLDLTRRHQWEQRVLCGHCCALSAIDEDEARRLLQQMRDAGVVLVSLPLANLQLQDGQPGRTPRWRGLPPLLEAREAGVPIALASDNVCDAFVGAADFDPLGVLSVAALCAHLDDPLIHWIDSVTLRPAQALGLVWDGVLRGGAPADLVLLDGRNSAEVLSRPGRRLLRAGAFERGMPPDFRELDG